MEKSSSFVNSSSMNYNYDSSIDSEESGWTSYFEEAFSDINGGQQSSFSYSSSPLISDAASSAAWRFSNTHNLDYTSPSTGDDLNLPKKLSFKSKTRNSKIFYDDSLEDTAISPVNSPKVSDVRGFDVNQRKTLFDNISSSAVIDSVISLKVHMNNMNEEVTKVGRFLIIVLNRQKAEAQRNIQKLKKRTVRAWRRKDCA